MIDNIPIFPTHLQIQTTTACITSCTFCPNSIISKQPRRLMNNILFNRIVDECGEYSPKYVSLYLMADPLTDPNIFRKIDYLRYKCPETWIELSTIGEQLNSKQIEGLFDSGVSELRISFPTINKEEYGKMIRGGNYERAVSNIERVANRYKSNEKSLKISVVVLQGLISDPHFNETVEYWKRREICVLSWPAVSRAGNLDTIQSNYKKNLSGCSQGRESHWMHIRYNGEVSLCCMDYSKKVCIGNVAHSTLESVWNSERYQNVREMAGGKLESDSDFPCKQCEWNGVWTRNATYYDYRD